MSEALCISAIVALFGRFLVANLIYRESVSTGEKSMLDMPRLLIGKEVCEVLCISGQSLRRMRQEGLIRYVRLRGALRYVEADVRALLSVTDSRLLHCECSGPCECPEIADT
jgi:hypothetical protein